MPLLDATASQPDYDALRKDLYEVGEIPPLGYVPKQMYAWAIRRERHGEPDVSFQLEVVDTPELDSNEVLVFVMAAGVNYNGVWAGLGIPISPFDVHKAPYHIAGSDASGIVWAVGDKVRRWKVGDEVVIHCNQDDGDDEHCNGGDPMYSPEPADLGLRDAERQLRAVHQRAEPAADGAAEAPDLGGERLLHADAGHRLPDAVRACAARAAAGAERAGLGGVGGLGSFAIQLINTAGGNAIGVISEENKRDFVLSLGAKGVINRKDFNCWGQMPTVNSPEYKEWLGEARKFGKAIWDITGKGVNVDMVFEHPGEATFPVSVLVVKKGGMVVICAGTTGYNLTLDARYLWMNQKRVQGSHFANLKQACAANQLMLERRLDPCMSEVFPWAQIPQAHVKMRRNEHKPGNMAVLVSAPTTGLRTLADTVEASLARAAEVGGRESPIRRGISHCG